MAKLQGKKVLIKMPHRVCESTCFINGIEDFLEWKGQGYPDYLLSVIGGMGGFAYLKFKRATPPRMVYTGASPKHLISDLEELIGFSHKLTENLSYAAALAKLKAAIDRGQPAMVGALDMYHLPYFKGMYRKNHAPIHYVMAVGYDDGKKALLVQDCSYPGVQAIPYAELQKAWNVNTPGVSRKNSLRVFKAKDSLPSELEAALKGFKYRAARMLLPPVSMFGIPAMRKLADEIHDWDDKGSFLHLATYVTVPPTLPKSFESSHGMRPWIAKLLGELGMKYAISSWLDAAPHFTRSADKFIELAKAAVKMDHDTISELMTEIADLEEAAYRIILDA